MNEMTDRSRGRVSLRSVRFSYRRQGNADQPFELQCAELEIAPLTSAALVGPSGSGKTTLLHLMAGILVPDAGQVRVGEIEVSRLDDAARRAFRVREIGLVFQDFQLLDYLDVRENLGLPFRIHPAQRWNTEAAQRVEAVAESLGIVKLLRRRIGQLSQGERQRVAIGRALVTRPRLLLADEPTGNLDPANKDRVLDLLLDAASVARATLVVVTHDHALLPRFEQVVDVASLLAGESQGARGTGAIQP